MAACLVLSFQELSPQTNLDIQVNEKNRMTGQADIEEIIGEKRRY